MHWFFIQQIRVDQTEAKESSRNYENNLGSKYAYFISC